MINQIDCFYSFINFYYGDSMRQDMYYIQKIWEHRSFTKAAQSLHVTQPALSTAVQKAENRIGMPIFNRTKRNIELTAAGAIYLAKADKITQLESELARELADLSEMHSGTLTVGGTNYLNAFVLPEVITQFHRRFPGITLKLVEASAEDLTAMLRNCEIDVTFNCEATEQKTPDKSLHRTPVFVDHILLATPKNLPVATKTKKAALTAQDVVNGRHLDPACPAVPIKDFSTLPCVLLTEGNNLRQRILAMFEKAKATPVIAFEAEQLVTAMHLAQAGLGAAFVSDRLISGHETSLDYYKINEANALRRFDAVSLARRYVTKAQEAFVKLAIDLCV